MIKKIRMLFYIKKYEWKNNVNWNLNFFSNDRDIYRVYLFITQLT